MNSENNFLLNEFMLLGIVILKVCYPRELGEEILGITASDFVSNEVQKWWKKFFCHFSDSQNKPWVVCLLLSDFKVTEAKKITEYL